MSWNVASFTYTAPDLLSGSWSYVGSAPIGINVFIVIRGPSSVSITPPNSTSASGTYTNLKITDLQGKNPLLPNATYTAEYAQTITYEPFVTSFSSQTAFTTGSLSTQIEFSSHSVVIPTLLTSIPVNWATNIAATKIESQIEATGVWQDHGNPSATSGTISRTTGVTPGLSGRIRLRSTGNTGGASTRESSWMNFTVPNIGTISASPDFNLGNTLNSDTSVASITTVTPSITSAAYNLELRVGTNLILTRTGIGNAGVKTITFTRAEQDELYRRMLNNVNTTVIWRLITVSGTNTWSNDRNATVIITGSQPTENIRTSGTWRRGFVWIRISNTWRRGLIWIRNSGNWRRGI